HDGKTRGNAIPAKTKICGFRLMTHRAAPSPVIRVTLPTEPHCQPVGNVTPEPQALGGKNVRAHELSNIATWPHAHTFFSQNGSIRIQATAEIWAVPHTDRAQ